MLDIFRLAIGSTINAWRGTRCFLSRTLNPTELCAEHGFHGGNSKDAWRWIPADCEKFLDERHSSGPHKSWGMVESRHHLKNGRIAASSCRLFPGSIRAQAIIPGAQFWVIAIQSCKTIPEKKRTKKLTNYACRNRNIKSYMCFFISRRFPNIFVQN